MNIHYYIALDWYKRGIIDSGGSIGDGIDADFYDQYKDQFPDEKEGSENYWKKRCEAAELNIETYSEWADIAGSVTSEDSIPAYIKWQSAFKNWQQLKSSIGEETEGQDELWKEVGNILKETWTLGKVKEKLKSKYTLIKKQ